MTSANFAIASLGGVQIFHTFMIFWNEKRISRLEDNLLKLLETILTHTNNIKKTLNLKETTNEQL